MCKQTNDGSPRMLWTDTQGSYILIIREYVTRIFFYKKPVYKKLGLFWLKP